MLFDITVEKVSVENSDGPALHRPDAVQFNTGLLTLSVVRAPSLANCI